LNEMFAWYIDNRYFITREFVDTLISNKEESEQTGEPLRSVIRGHMPDPNKGNPSSPITFAKNVGLLKDDDSYSDSLRLYKEGIYPFSCLLLDLMSKRNVSKSEDIPMKPIVCLAIIFSSMLRQNIAADERFVTTAEIYEYISVLDSYDDITDELIRRIVDERTYSGATHFPDKRVEVKNEVYISSIFSALNETPLFRTGIRKSALHCNENLIELIDYIAEHGKDISIAPIATGSNNKELYDYLGCFENGVAEIIPKVRMKEDIEILPKKTQALFEYLFDVVGSQDFPWTDYFVEDCRGCFRIFYPIRWMPLLSIYLINARLGEHLLDYAEQAQDYIETTKEGRYMIEIPFASSGHMSLDELTHKNNEEVFKAWLKKQKKNNGELYSQNSQNQYMVALRGVSTDFENAIAPYESVFEIDDTETITSAIESIKSSNNYEEVNSSRGNGSLSAGLALYAKFLTEKAMGADAQFLSPEWFRQKAQEYPNIDAEAEVLYQQFQALYAPEKLAALNDDELLGYIFLGVSDSSLCNALEFDSQYGQFGSIAGGTAYKYNLFYSRNDATWKTSYGDGGQRSCSEEDALSIGKEIRDALVKGAEIIANFETLATPNDYTSLLAELTAAIPQYITKMWFLKYYHMLYPSLITSFYNETWHKHILCNLNIVPSDAQFVRMGQINCFVNECGISNMVFGKIIFDTIGMPRTFYRIGTGDNGCYLPEWQQNNYVAIGWNELGDLSLAYAEDADSKAVITEALKSNWNYDNRLASRKYGEINNFYSAVADTTFVVAMSGYKILAIGELSGSYYFNDEREYGHCRPVRWLKVFAEPKTLPVEDEGKLTTFYELKNSENICYLYTLLHGTGADVDLVDEIESEAIRPINTHTGYQSKYGRNRILFGAPGTGKSFTLNGDRKELLYGDREVDEEAIDRSLYGEYERVTFHPDYSYANFVGTYKPVPCKDDQGHDAITYSYVPGPFMRTYVKALLNSRTDSPKPYLLVIEEINRANVAAVFGDVFQLLDRDDDEVSEYAIQASEDIKKYLAEKLGGDPEEYAEIRIPDNMFIWATMNSADQGVFPMDTAFKRRWDFTYLGIDDSEDGIKGKTVVLGEGQYKRVVEWNKLRKAINDELLTYKVNEDKLMGPYFISKKNLPEGTEIDVKTFTRIFKNKVIMYLFDDAAKQKRLTLFGGCDEKSKSQYSKICSEFDKKGVYIFCDAISNQFIDSVPANEVKEDDAE